MSQLNLTAPITFEPIFMERMWGGRRLESTFRKNLPANARIGESWEIVDRSEAQSVVANGPLKGKTLHELWTHYREEVFGEAGRNWSPRRPLPRFPLLVKLLDAQEKLSLQVHPPKSVAVKLEGEPKTEFWYVAAAEPGAEIFVGFREAITRQEFEAALRDGSAADHLHLIRVKPGDAMFLPAGRFHAVGAGCLLVEIQQNSDTTYRVFDWNRVDPATAKPRQLHVDLALECIDFNDVRPEMAEPRGELLVRHELFEIQKWNLESPRQIAPAGQFAIVCCLTGKLMCGDVDLNPGEFFLVPASLQNRRMKPVSTQTTLLHVSIPTL